MSTNTLFLRLEGPLQSWGVQESKFLIRRTAPAPTKSGVIGLLCAALGVTRMQANDQWLPRLADLSMGVRVDAPGVRWWDYHTVGAGLQMRIAEGPNKTKPGAMPTRREYLCDASFLVALQGSQSEVDELEEALRNPKFLLYLGRKACPPSRPIVEHRSGHFCDLDSALRSVPFRRRVQGEKVPGAVNCLLDWKPTSMEPEVPLNALVWYDVPVSFEPPYHTPRFVIQKTLVVGSEGEISLNQESLQKATPRPVRPRANYSNSEYTRIRNQRLSHDYHLCVFCKSPATTVQHVTYRHAGGNERIEELRALCRLCHDAVTMIEYGLGMGMDRIDPCDPIWRKLIIEKRDQIVSFRSLETRRRRLQPEEVE